MATPSGVTIKATNPEGIIEDVTEGVQTLYDLLIGSMDWGSGFLTVEDVMPVARIAHFCGFSGHEEVDKYIATEQREKDITEALHTKEAEVQRRLTIEERTEIRERFHAGNYPKW